MSTQPLSTPSWTTSQLPTRAKRIYIPGTGIRAIAVTLVLAGSLLPPVAGINLSMVGLITAVLFAIGDLIRCPSCKTPLPQWHHQHTMLSYATMIRGIPTAVRWDRGHVGWQ